MKLSRDVQIVLGGVVLYVIFSFFDWQSYSIGPFSYGVNEWHGFGIIVRAARDRAARLGADAGVRHQGPDRARSHPDSSRRRSRRCCSCSPSSSSSTGASYRSWPECVGLILAIVIGVVAFRRAKRRGCRDAEHAQEHGIDGRRTELRRRLVARPTRRPAPGAIPAPTAPSRPAGQVSTDDILGPAPHAMLSRAAPAPCAATG